jgi:hypothetical protein
VGREGDPPLLADPPSTEVHRLARGRAAPGRRRLLPALPRPHPRRRGSTRARARADPAGGAPGGSRAAPGPASGRAALLGHPGRGRERDGAGSDVAGPARRRATIELVATVQPAAGLY